MIRSSYQRLIGKPSVFGTSPNGVRYGMVQQAVVFDRAAADRRSIRVREFPCARWWPAPRRAGGAEHRLPGISSGSGRRLLLGRLSWWLRRRVRRARRPRSPSSFFLGSLPGRLRGMRDLPLRRRATVLLLRAWATAPGAPSASRAAPSAVCAPTAFLRPPMPATSGCIRRCLLCRRGLQPRVTLIGVEQGARQGRRLREGRRAGWRTGRQGP
jgi:hypothetical protein